MRNNRGSISQATGAVLQSVQDDAGQALSALTRALTEEATFGSVTLSARTGTLGGPIRPSVGASLARGRLSVSIDRGLVPVGLGAQKIQTAQTSAIAGHRTELWALTQSDFMDETGGVAFVSVNPGDPADYTTFGYWLTLRAPAGTLMGIEIGAFADGPEFDKNRPPEIPVIGTARYEGIASGWYASQYGGDVAARTRRSIGTTEFGGFVGDATLTADFETSRISGCVGCQKGIDYFGWWGDPVTGASGELEYTFPGSIAFSPTSINSKGQFRGTGVKMTAPAGYPYSITSSAGTWGGQLSNISDQEGHPRSASGVFAFGAETAGGSSTFHIGSYLAGKR